MLERHRLLHMEFFTTDPDGVTLMDPDADARLQLLKSVADSEADYPEAFLTHPSGEVLGYRAGGILVREQNGEVTGFLDQIEPEAAARIWEYLVIGDMDSLDSLPWQKA